MTGDLRGKLTARLKKSFHEETDTHPSVFLRFFFLLDDLFAGGVSPSLEASGDANNDAGLTPFHLLESNPTIRTFFGSGCNTGTASRAGIIRWFLPRRFGCGFLGGE